MIGNISLLEVDIKKILDDFRENLDSSGEIGTGAYYALFAVYLVAIIVGIFGNILILTAVLGRKRMRSARNVFIVTLAISDLILCIFTMPSTLWEVRISFIKHVVNTGVQKVAKKWPKSGKKVAKKWQKNGKKWQKSSKKRD